MLHSFFLRQCVKWLGLFWKLMQKNLFCLASSASSNFVMTFGLCCAPRFSWGCCTIGFGHSTRWCAGSSPPPILGPPATDVLRSAPPLVLRPAFQEPKARCRPRPKTSLSALMFRPLTKNRAAAALTPGTTTSLHYLFGSKLLFPPDSVRQSAAP